MPQIKRDNWGKNHQVVFATGNQAGKMLNIPGADLVGNHAASDFVAWYNGHPDFRDRRFDLSVESAAVVGIGNVALDVARILVRSPEESGADGLFSEAGS